MTFYCAFESGGLVVRINADWIPDDPDVQIEGNTSEWEGDSGTCPSKGKFK